MQLDTVEQALDFLKRAGSVSGSGSDCDLNVYHCALAFARLFHKDFDVKPYLEHEEQLIDAVKNRFEQALTEGAEDSLALRRICLVEAMHDEMNYIGDDDGYDQPESADMVSVVDRRQGLPVALGILYIQTARELGGDLVGLNFPGHFLVRLSFEGQNMILDPFREGEILNASDMREILKVISGQSAELSHNFYEPLNDHAVILRLQNNLKKRYIDAGHYNDALIVVEAMRMFAPTEYRLLFDAALLKTKTGHMKAALVDVQEYCEQAQTPREKQHAEQLLFEIQRAMN
jgi:regulator of sirC expression with transglutaminase-like and TPR domain